MTEFGAGRGSDTKGAGARKSCPTKRKTAYQPDEWDRKVLARVIVRAASTPRYVKP